MRSRWTGNAVAAAAMLAPHPWFISTPVPDTEARVLLPLNHPPGISRGRLRSSRTCCLPRAPLPDWGFNQGGQQASMMGIRRSWEEAAGGACC